MDEELLVNTEKLEGGYKIRITAPFLEGGARWLRIALAIPTDIGAASTDIGADGTSSIASSFLSAVTNKGIEEALRERFGTHGEEIQDDPDTHEKVIAHLRGLLDSQQGLTPRMQEAYQLLQEVKGVIAEQSAIARESYNRERKKLSGRDWLEEEPANLRLWEISGVLWKKAGRLLRKYRAITRYPYACYPA